MPCVKVWNRYYATTGTSGYVLDILAEEKNNNNGCVREDFSEDRERQYTPTGKARLTNTGSTWFLSVQTTDNEGYEGFKETFSARFGENGTPTSPLKSGYEYYADALYYTQSEQYDTDPHIDYTIPIDSENDNDGMISKVFAWDEDDKTIHATGDIFTENIPNQNDSAARAYIIDYGFRRHHFITKFVNQRGEKINLGFIEAMEDQWLGSTGVTKIEVYEKEPMNKYGKCEWDSFAQYQRIIPHVFGDFELKGSFSTTADTVDETMLKVLNAPDNDNSVPTTGYLNLEEDRIYNYIVFNETEHEPFEIKVGHGKGLSVYVRDDSVINEIEKSSGFTEYFSDTERSKFVSAISSLTSDTAISAQKVADLFNNEISATLNSGTSRVFDEYSDWLKENGFSGNTFTTTYHVKTEYAINTEDYTKGYTKGDTKIVLNPEEKDLGKIMAGHKDSNTIKVTKYTDYKNATVTFKTTAGGGGGTIGGDIEEGGIINP